MPLQDQRNSREGSLQLESPTDTKTCQCLPVLTEYFAAGARPLAHTANLVWTPPLGVCGDAPEQVQHIPGAGEVMPQTQDLWVVGVEALWMHGLRLYITS